MFNKIEKKYLGDMLHYIGIGFIGGSISHGFFSGERSVIMAIIGLVLFVGGEFIQKDDIKEMNYLKILFIGVVYSLAVGMVNGGFQHFLDSPERSLWIIPLGLLISVFIFPIKEDIQFKDYKKSFINLFVFGFIITMLLFVVYYSLPKSFYSGLSDHHIESQRDVIGETKTKSPIETKTDIQSVDGKKVEVSEIDMESENEHHGH